MPKSVLRDTENQGTSEAVDMFAELFTDLIWKQYWDERRKEWNTNNGKHHFNIKPSLHDGE